MYSCVSCNGVFDSSLFYKDDSKKRGYSSYCKPCRKKNSNENYHKNHSDNRKTQKEYYHNNPEKYKEYNYRRYGINTEIYNQMFLEQEGCCAICKTHHLELKRGLFIDHCHSSGEVRGLLCQYCNSMLGMCKDRIDVLEAGIEYLKGKDG